MDADGMLAILARAVGDLKDAVLITEGERGPDGLRRIIFVNRAFTEITGFAREEAVGAVPDITIGPETSREALEKIRVARDARMPVRVELVKYRKDRTTFWAELDVVPVFDADGKLTHNLGVMRDVTERRLAHARLLETERLASLGSLTAGIAHEINNPLAFVQMNLHFLEEEVPALVGENAESPRVKELLSAVAEMREGVERVGRIVRDLKSFSRVDEERGQGPCDVAAALERSIQMAQTGLPFGIKVERKLDEVPPVLGDANRLGQVFLNVLINALDAIPEAEVAKRGVEVRTFVADEEVLVEIEDQGVGIPPEVLPRVFDPFFTTKPTGSGTGLGLSVSHGVVKSFGGTMTIESIVGKGTTVRIALRPFKDAAEAKAASGEGGVGAALRRLRILVVDDEPMVVRSLRRALSVHHEVVVCEGGQSALELLGKEREFHAILCDLSMPGVSGADLFAEIEQRWPGLEKRVIIMTGGACTDAGHAFLARAVAPRFDKPLDLSALRRALERVAEPGA